MADSERAALPHFQSRDRLVVEFEEHAGVKPLGRRGPLLVAVQNVQIVAPPTLVERGDLGHCDSLSNSLGRRTEGTSMSSVMTSRCALVSK